MASAAGRSNRPEFCGPKPPAAEHRLPLPRPTRGADRSKCGLQSACQKVVSWCVYLRQSMAATTHRLETGKNGRVRKTIGRECVRAAFSPLPPYPTGFFRGCPRARASTRCRTRAALLKLASTQRTHARVKGRRICKSVTMAAQAIDLAGVEGARDTGVTQAWTQHAGSRSHSTVKRCAAERVQKLRDCLRIDLLDCRRSSATSDFRRQHTCRHDELIFPCSTYPVA